MADARRVSADWQRLAVEQAAVGIVQLGPDGTLWEANPGFCRMLGVAADELLGKSLAERLHPEDVAGWRGWIGRAAAGDVDAYTVEVRALRPSRGVVWLEASVTVARDEDGQMRFCVGVVQDVSARHEAERALRRRVAKFFAAFDAAQVPMTQTDPATGRFERANPPFCELTGYTESELRERTMQQLVHPEESGHEADVSPGFTPEKRYVRKDGAVLWAIRYASPMYHDSGELFRTLSAWVDVSARRRTEDALGLSEARFRTLAEAGPFMVYSSDADGLPSYLSPSLVAYLGLTVAQLRDEDVIRSIVYADDFAHVAALRAPVAAVTTAELRLRRADGEFRWVLARTVSLLDDAGRFVQRIGSLTDIHDRKQAELALAGSEERFRIASEAVDGLIYDLDLTTGHTYRSAGFTTTLGWALDEIAPTAGAWEALIHPDDRDATLERSAGGDGGGPRVVRPRVPRTPQGGALGRPVGQPADPARCEGQARFAWWVTASTSRPASAQRRRCAPARRASRRSPTRRRPCSGARPSTARTAGPARRGCDTPAARSASRGRGRICCTRSTQSARCPCGRARSRKRVTS